MLLPPNDQPHRRHKWPATSQAFCIVGKMAGHQAEILHCCCMKSLRWALHNDLFRSTYSASHWRQLYLCSQTEPPPVSHQQAGADHHYIPASPPLSPLCPCITPPPPQLPSLHPPPPPPCNYHTPCIPPPTTSLHPPQLPSSPPPPQLHPCITPPPLCQKANFSTQRQ